MIAPALPMAIVSTGTPPGICTIDSSESMPFSAWLSTGTPSTGSNVCAATMPGRWAAPPAPAMITSMPRGFRRAANSAINSGVRWAETIRHSCGTLKSRQHLVGMAQRVPIGLAAHDHGHKWFDFAVDETTLLTLAHREAGLAAMGVNWP